MVSEWYPVALAGVVSFIGMFGDPAKLHPLQVWPPPLDLARAPTFLLSPWFLCLAIPAVVGVVQLRKMVAPEDRAVVIWWWLNMTFFLTVCDCLSGLVQVMPNLTALYKILNKDHELPRFHPDRAVMDVIYCSELATIPLIAYTVLLYTRGDPKRYVMDALLAGMQTCGAVAYYVPDLVLGEHTSIITNVDRAVAFSWIIMSAYMFQRALKGIDDLAAGRSTTGAKTKAL